MSRNDIIGLHHVGLVVAELGRAMATFERLGFDVKAPAYAAMAPAPGEEPQPIGATNTHADFPRNFVELAGLAPGTRDRLPEGANLIPLSVPEDRREATLTAIRTTVANLDARLKLGEGAHILVFATRDAERTAKRLDDAGVGHGGARAAQRPVTTADGVELADIRFLELDDDDPCASRGLLPEGRVGMAEDAPAELLDAQLGLAHPNGAVALVECVLSVGETDWEPTVDRYERYLGVEAKTTDAAVFELGSSRVTIVTPRRFGELFPGEGPARRAEARDRRGDVTARLTAYTVEVADLPRAQRLLAANGVELGRHADGRPFVPARAAHGAALVLEQR